MKKLKKAVRPKPVKAWAMQHTRTDELFSGSKPVRLFEYKYEAEAAIKWGVDNAWHGAGFYIPVRVLITVVNPK